MSRRTPRDGTSAATSDSPGTQLGQPDGEIYLMDLPGSPYLARQAPQYYSRDLR